VKEYLVNYISCINNILVKVKFMELIEAKVGLMWEWWAEGGSVATRCPASGSLGGRTHTPNKAPGPYA
jgi:hypothetical protein